MDINIKIKLGFYRIKKDYTDYLRGYHPHVQHNDPINHATIWTGIIVDLNHYKYFIPLTSDKNNVKKNDMFSVRIEPDNNTGKTGEYYGAILISQMIPVPEGSFEKIDFEDTSLDIKYLNLLKIQYYLINILETKRTILNKAITLYEIRYTNDGRRKIFDQKCLDFHDLERLCEEYKKSEMQKSLSL
jgi:protein AbiQ